jgi:hypothetical protein
VQESSRSDDTADVQWRRRFGYSPSAGRGAGTPTSKTDPFVLMAACAGLIQQASHLAVALRRAVAVLHAGAFVIAWASAHPRRELLRRREGIHPAKTWRTPDFCILSNSCTPTPAGEAPSPVGWSSPLARPGDAVIIFAGEPFIARPDDRYGRPSASKYPDAAATSGGEVRPT